MTFLGTYVVPSDTSKAGQERFRGSGHNGLQEDFADACNKVVEEGRKIGISVELGYSGFVSRSSAEDWSRNGNPPFLSNIKYFGYGLGWEITSGPTVNVMGPTTSAQKTALQTQFVNIVKDMGLTMIEVRSSNAVQLKFLAPMYLKTDDIDAVKYNGDSTKFGADGSEEYGENSSSVGAQASASSVAYFFANQFASIQSVGEAYLLQGERALANDEPLWDSVKKAVNASLRSCASGPNGEFFAWYPDYWGMAGQNTPNLILEDIELVDLKITQSDDEYYSHVYTPGVNVSGTDISLLLTQGVVSIESDLAAEASEASLTDDDSAYLVSDEVSGILKQLIYIPQGEEWKYTPKELYRRYGARPNKTASVSSTAKLIETGTDGQSSDAHPQYILPFLYALYEFMKHWSNQYKATLTMTFMPNLFPGSRIKLRSFDIEFYVEGVTHSVDYSSGFTTTATCTCPVGSLVSGMVQPKG